MSDLSSEYDQWHQLRLDKEQDSALKKENFACWHQMILPRLGEIKGLRIAEIGCGRGNFAIFLAGCGAIVTAVDFSENAIQIAKERSDRLGVTVDWRVGDAQSTRLPADDFDLVISCECMEHVPEPRQMMTELTRILRPGGRLLLTTPSQLNAQLLGWLHAWWQRKPYNSGSGVQPHENLFFTWQIVRWLKKSGLLVIGRDARIFPYLLLPGINPARLRIDNISSRVLGSLFRPFGLHQLYEALKKDGT